MTIMAEPAGGSATSVIRGTLHAQALDAQVLHYKDGTDLEVDAVVECADGRWGALEVKLGPGMVDQAAATLLAFAGKVDTDRCGSPRFLAVVTGFGLGYVRADACRWFLSVPSVHSGNASPATDLGHTSHRVTLCHGRA